MSFPPYSLLFSGSRGIDYRARWGLVEMWELEEASGTRVGSYGGNNLTANNSPGQAAGVVGNAVSLVAASSQSLSIADNTDLSTGDVDFLMAAWVYLSTTGATRVIAAKLTNGSVGEWNLYVSTTNLPTFGIFNAGAAKGGVASGTALTASTWNLITAYHDSVNNLVAVAVNGGAFATSATTGAPADTATAFTLGSFTGGVAFWNGRLDQAVFCKSPPLGIAALASEIRDTLYNGGLGRSYLSISGG